jgi:hypothetical protein
MAATKIFRRFSELLDVSGFRSGLTNGTSYALQWNSTTGKFEAAAVTSGLTQTTADARYGQLAASNSWSQPNTFQSSFLKLSNGSVVTTLAAPSSGGPYTFTLPGASGTAVVSGSITWPGVLFTSPTTASISSAGAMSYSPQLATQTAKFVLAGPTSGAAATPTFRQLATTDLSDATNVALLNAANTFTNSGVTSFAGGIALPSNTTSNATILNILAPSQAAFSEPVWRIGVGTGTSIGIRSSGVVQMPAGASFDSLSEVVVEGSKAHFGRTSYAGVTFPDSPSQGAITFGKGTITSKLFATEYGRWTPNGGLAIGTTTDPGAGNLTVSGGTITGGASGLTFAAGGTNQRINLNPSGTAGVVITNNTTLFNGGVLDVHAKDATPFVGRFFNDTYSTTVPGIQYYVANSGASYITGSLAASTSLGLGNDVFNSNQILLNQAGSISLTATGTNQNITLTASGTGSVSITGPSNNAKLLIGTIPVIEQNTGATYIGTNSFQTRNGFRFNSHFELRLDSNINWYSSDFSGTKDAGIGRNAAGVVEVNTGTAGTFRDLKVRALVSNAVTFANAVTSPAQGTLQEFTDSSTTTFGATITGGGSGKVLGRYNGTNWVVVSA